MDFCMKMKHLMALACAATLSFGAAAQAATISVSTFDLTSFGNMIGTDNSIENFESYTGGALSGPLTGTAVGTFTSLGTTGSGSTCQSNGGGTCTANLAIQDGGINGQGNLLPLGGSKSLNSNDTLGILWDVFRAGNATFNRIVFGLRDGGEFKKMTITAGGETATFGPGAGNNNEKLVVIDFSSLITNATITLEHNGINDGFTIDGATAASVVPLPAGAWLMLTGLAGLMAARRRKTS
jgi:hypothetical protein